MKNWINEDKIVGDCPWQQDIEDARSVCDKLGIEFRVVNLMRDYKDKVVKYQGKAGVKTYLQDQKVRFHQRPMQNHR